jgi:hypothetical protein
MTRGWPGACIASRSSIRCTGWMDDGFHVPLAVGVMALLEHACDTAIPSALLPFFQSVLRYRLKTLLEIERMHARPSWLCRDGAPMPWVGFKAQQDCHGVRPWDGRDSGPRGKTLWLPNAPRDLTPFRCDRAVSGVSQYDKGL